MEKRIVVAVISLACFMAYAKESIGVSVDGEADVRILVLEMRSDG